MIKIGLVGLTLGLMLGVTGQARPALAQNTQNFTIKSFEADYYLSRNPAGASDLMTTEVITAEFPDIDQNHGILRAIPKVYQTHTISLKIDAVTDGSGAPRNYTAYDQNDNKVLKIGDPNNFVHGEQIYKITYESKNVIDLGPKQDSFFWDVNGDQWDQPFGDVVARVHLAPDISGRLQGEQVCYSGYSGNTSHTGCTVTQTADSGGGSLVTIEAKNLNPSQVLSFGMAFSQGTFVQGPEVAREQKTRHIAIIGGALLALVIPAAAGLLMFKRWRQFGNDPKGRGVIIPQYQPPKGLTVLYSDFILNEKLRGKAFSAALIDLAVHKVLKISEIEKQGFFGHTDYELQIISLPPELSAHTKKAMDIIFDGSIQPGSAVRLSDLQKRAQASRDISNKMKELEKNIGGYLAGQGYFINNPISTAKKYRSWASGLAVAGLLLTFGLGHILGQAPVGLEAFLVGLDVGLFLVAAVVFGFSFIMPARSLAGVQARDELLGLKDYIKLAEADRLKFLQSPQGAEKIADKSAFNPKDPVMMVKLFENLLPYAILFGLEKQWAAQFQGIYTQPPDWYHGNWVAFNSLYLADSLSGFASSNALSFSSPSSSSGGFSGGAGGGGGGGGGGGW